MRNRGPLCGSSALLPPLPPKPYVSTAPQPYRTSPNPAQLIFTAQCRSASVRAVCQSGSSRVHLLFIYKELRIRSMPPYTHRKHSHWNKNMRVAGRTASSERGIDALWWTLLCICVGLIPRALRLLFVLSIRAAYKREALTHTVGMFNSPTSHSGEPVLLNDSFETIRMGCAMGCSHKYIQIDTDFTYRRTSLLFVHLQNSCWKQTNKQLKRLSWLVLEGFCPLL